MSMEGFTKCPLVLIGVLCLQLGPVLTYYEKTCTLETRREGPKGICGSRLPELLNLVCMQYGGFREKWFRKRDTEYSEYTPHYCPCTIITALVPPLLPLYHHYCPCTTITALVRQTSDE